LENSLKWTPWFWDALFSLAQLNSARVKQCLCAPFQLFSINLATTKKEEEEDKGGAVATGTEEGDIKKTDSYWLL
jgi:hypothetical protein